MNSYVIVKLEWRETERCWPFLWDLLAKKKERVKRSPLLAELNGLRVERGGSVKSKDQTGSVWGDSSLAAELLQRGQI